ncbi:type I restriction endonuclease [Anabaena azotica]|uniref:Restriction endonuclease subunit R n=1 Tax=Anabaena azotica FACHB-119 TaxID=947527 RepID=A0ABR8D9Q0_9NOST|nr:type I restriction endonuclease [Anabaena azotica]MBD2503030.1 restriction endonuclease subunit R [Anabaena azotica FACHB-119]
MVQIIQAKNIGLAYLKERFGLQRVEDEAFFTEWLDNLPEITDVEKQYLDRVKSNFLNLAQRPPILENAVKMVVLSPLLDLAGFYSQPFAIGTEESIEISVEDEGEVIRGRIDILVIQKQFWLLVIESKRAGISLLENIPQALAYMLASPNQDKPVFGLLTNGSHFMFIKLIKTHTPTYDISDEFTLLKRKNELYEVLVILKNFSQLLS